MIVNYGGITNYSLTDVVREIGYLTRLDLPTKSPYSQITSVVPGTFPYKVRIISCHI